MIYDYITSNHITTFWYLCCWYINLLSAMISDANYCNVIVANPCNIQLLSDGHFVAFLNITLPLISSVIDSRFPETETIKTKREAGVSGENLRQSQQSRAYTNSFGRGDSLSKILESSGSSGSCCNGSAAKTASKGTTSLLSEAHGIAQSSGNITSRIMLPLNVDSNNATVDYGLGNFNNGRKITMTATIQASIKVDIQLKSSASDTVPGLAVQTVTGAKVDSFTITNVSNNFNQVSDQELPENVDSIGNNGPAPVVVDLNTLSQMIDDANGSMTEMERTDGLAQFIQSSSSSNSEKKKIINGVLATNESEKCESSGTYRNNCKRSLCLNLMNWFVNSSTISFVMTALILPGTWSAICFNRVQQLLGSQCLVAEVTATNSTHTYQGACKQNFSLSIGGGFFEEICYPESNFVRMVNRRHFNAEERISENYEQVTVTFSYDLNGDLFARDLPSLENKCMYFMFVYSDSSLKQPLIAMSPGLVCICTPTSGTISSRKRTTNNK